MLEDSFGRKLNLYILIHRRIKTFLKKGYMGKMKNIMQYLYKIKFGFLI